MANNRVYPVTVEFSASALTQNTSLTSNPIDINLYKPQGYYSATLTTAGAGTAKLEYLLCDTIDGTYVTPSDASDIVTAHTAGTDRYKLEPKVAQFMKIKITETNVGAISAFSVVLSIS